MKKLQISGLAISTALCLPMIAHASDGTITFTGALVASTCSVSTGTLGSFSVTLPTLATTTLAASGNTAGATGFDIAVTGCASSGVNFTPFFESGANTDLASGRLNATTGSATNVQLQLLNGNGTVIDVSKAAGAQGVVATSITSGGGTGHYRAQYYATGATGVGTVSSTVTYSMVYQ